MPHCTLEHSSNIAEIVEPASFFRKIHTMLVEMGPFELSAIKSRICPREQFFVSDGERNQSFIHLELAILAGRDSQTKQAISSRLLDFLLREFPQTAASQNCSFTVEIRDIDSECYSKAKTGNV